MKKNELSLRELEDVVGGDCYYEGQQYSEGAEIYNPLTGTTLTCKEGKWK